MNDKTTAQSVCVLEVEMKSAKETVVGAVLELVNASYEDGRSGANGWYPLDAAEMLSDFEKKCGRQIDGIVPITRKIIAAMNAAYERGRNEAGR